MLLGSPISLKKLGIKTAVSVRCNEITYYKVAKDGTFSANRKEQVQRKYAAKANKIK